MPTRRDDHAIEPASSILRVQRLEAGVSRQLPGEVSLLLLCAFRMRRLGMLVCILGVLLSLVRVLFALGVVILAVRFGSGAMGLRRSFVMFCRLVVGVFHLDFLLLADEYRLGAQATSIAAARSAKGVRN